MTYRNNNKRVIRLAQLGLIEEIKTAPHNVVNIHGRKDYKVTRKGLKHLIPYVITHPDDDVKVVPEDMDRSGLDKQAFGEILVTGTTSMIKSTYEYLKSMGKPELLTMDIEQITPLQRFMAKLDIEIFRPMQRVNAKRSLRRRLAQEQAVGATLKPYHVKLDDGRNIETIEIVPSDFQKRQQRQQQRQKQQEKEEQHKPITMPKKKH